MAPALIQEIIEDSKDHQSIQLNDVEANLARLLLDVAAHIQAYEKTAKIVLRFTGGWVRDKLLDVPSHDVDVAINNMTGYQFGTRLKAYLEISGNPEKYGLDGVATTEKQDQKAGMDKSKTVGGLHKIEANPEKSKHLETVTTRIFGLDVDLVNLRKETYSDDSRNPQMEFGTPEEDALRRDATVNAMFYNLNTQQVEDFTQQGHKDMHDKILRTPLEPYQTFKDDPLRVLRLIRFASRLGWEIESTTLEAMKHSDIKEALHRKISRERIGIELDKALQGPDPHEALRLILDLGLYETIYCDPALENNNHYRPDLDNQIHVIDILKRLLSSENDITKIAIRTPEEHVLAWQLASLIPYRDAPTPEATQAGRKPPPPIPTQVAREGIKATSKFCDLITSSVRHVEEIRLIVDGLYQQRRRTGGHTGRDYTARDYLGMSIRDWGTAWRSQVVFALLTNIADEPAQTDSYIRRYSEFLKHLESLDILEVCQLRPLLDGKALAKALNTRPGPWMKEALDVVIAWQLRHPDKTNVDEAIAEVRMHHGELAFTLAEHFLKLTIRPLFIKTQPTSITTYGRMATTNNIAPHSTSSLDDSNSRPWKDAQNTHALSLLQWSITSLNEDTIQQLWPLIIPPILTLLDDWEVKYKTLGLDLLHTTLQTTSPTLLKRTGLAPVFEEAILPCLTYLPPLTKTAEAQDLLPSVYQALKQLASIQPNDRTRLLDKLVRDGIIYGYSHTNERPKIVTALLQQLTELLDELKVESVKHLKFLLPMLSEVLSNTLNRSHPICLQTATYALQAVLRNCWPRMIEHRGEVLKGLTLCWLNVVDLDAEELRQALRQCVSLLRSAIGSQIDLEGELQSLVLIDQRLSPLFIQEERTT